jgi:hypothetical protein
MEIKRLFKTKLFLITVIIALTVIISVLGVTVVIPGVSDYIEFRKGVTDAEKTLEEGNVLEAEKAFKSLGVLDGYASEIEKVKKEKGKSILESADGAFVNRDYTGAVRLYKEAKDYVELETRHKKNIETSLYLIERTNTGLIYDNHNTDGDLFRVEITDEIGKYRWYMAKEWYNAKVIDDYLINLYKDKRLKAYFKGTDTGDLSFYMKSSFGDIKLGDCVPGSVAYAMFENTVYDWQLMSSLD